MSEDQESKVLDAMKKAGKPVRPGAFRFKIHLEVPQRRSAGVRPLVAGNSACRAFPAEHSKNSLDNDSLFWLIEGR